MSRLKAICSHKSVSCYDRKKIESGKTFLTYKRLDAIILTRCSHSACNLINYKFIALTPFPIVKMREKRIQLKIFHVQCDWICSVFFYFYIVRVRNAWLRKKEGKLKIYGLLCGMHCIANKRVKIELLMRWASLMYMLFLKE